LVLRYWHDGVIYEADHSVDLDLRVDGDGV